MKEFKQTLETYRDIIPKDRLRELELHALHLLTGEEIETMLWHKDAALGKEYADLMENA